MDLSLSKAASLSHELTKKRKLFNFSDLGIPHLFSLGKVELLSSTTPIASHTHSNSFEICVHFEGSQYYEINSIGYETHAGDIFISFPNEHHSTGNRSEEKSRFFYLIFECMPHTQNFIGLDSDESDYIVSKLFSIKNRIFLGSAKLRPILQEVIDVYFDDKPLKSLKIRSLMLDFFYELCFLIDKSLDYVATPKDIEFACDYILSNITESLSVEDIAQKAFLSESQFKKKFKQYTSFSPHDYIVRQKVLVAKDMLSYTYFPVTKISFELGFSSSQLFSKVFKKYTGTSPRDYRKSLKSGL